MKQLLKTEGRNHQKYWPYKIRAIANTTPRGKMLSRLVWLDMNKRRNEQGRGVSAMFGRPKPLKCCRVITSEKQES